MKLVKKLLGLAAVVAIVAATSLTGVVSLASAATYTPTFDVCEETSPFAAVRVLGQQQKINAMPGHYVNGQYIWSVPGNPAPKVNLSLAVSVNDWSKATEMRIRFKSNGLDSANANSADNNFAIGFGGWNTDGSGVYRKITKPYGNAKFTNIDGKVVSTLYYVASHIPYINVGRWQNCYVQIPLDDTSFQDVKGNEASIFKLGPVAGSEVTLDMSRIEFVYITLEPMNYNSMCFDFGNIEIKIDGEWVTVFDASKTTIKEKISSHRNTILSMADNQCYLDPENNEQAQNTTDCYQLSLIEATPCTKHFDNNFDGMCDLCFNYMPHVFFDLLGDGACDDCGRVICGDGVCVDNGGDGACDVCYHNDFVEQPAPVVPDTGNSAQSSNTIIPPANNSSAKKGCRGMVGGTAILTLASLAVVAVFVSKRQK